MRCQICGAEFQEGEDPATGIPNGVGLQFNEDSSQVFTVCSSCVMHRYEDVIAEAMVFKRALTNPDAIDF